MKIVDAGYEILDPLNGEEILKKIERVARVCYKSEDKITEGSAEKMVRALIKSNHMAMLEHYSFSVKFICDRGVSHEIVRHRVASYAQESTRYCNYSKGNVGDVTFIRPCFFTENSVEIRIIDEDDYRYDREADGWCDPSVKEILIFNYKQSAESVKDLIAYQKKVLRHEIVHAFLYESGLWQNAYGSKCWAKNEEMIDWMAIQIPKIQRAYKEAYCDE